MAELPACDAEIYRNGVCVGIFAEVPSWAMEAIVKSVADFTGQPVDWHFAAGRAVVKTTGDVKAVQHAISWLPVVKGAREYAVRPWGLPASHYPRIQHLSWRQRLGIWLARTPAKELV